MTSRRLGVEPLVGLEGQRYDRTGRRLRAAGVELVEPPPFNARAALRRSGFTARGVAGRAARRSSSAAATFSRGSGLRSVGAGGLLIFVGFTIIGLAVLRAALGGRGPAGVDRIFSLAGGGLHKLLSPTDVLIAAGHPTPAPSTSSTSSSSGTIVGGSSSAPQSDVLTGHGYSAAGGFATVPGQYAQRSGIQVARGDLALVESIAQHFGVKVSSGLRSPATNAEVGGAPNSDHLRGTAVDFAGPPAALRALFSWAQAQHFPYVEPLGQSKDHVHISFQR